MTIGTTLRAPAIARIRIRMRPLLGAFAACLIVASCSGNITPSDRSSVGADGDTDSASSVASEPEVKLVDYGFGQSGPYVQGIAMITTNSDVSVGEFVTVSVNFLNRSGRIIGTEEQTESFSWVGQQLVLPIWLDLSDNPTAKASKIKPSITIGTYGATSESRPALPVLKSTEVKKSRFRGTEASFVFKNNTAGDLKNLRVTVVCYRKDGKIIGGSSTYPDLSPARKTIRIDSDVTTSGTPESCEAFLNYGDI